MVQLQEGFQDEGDEEFAELNWDPEAVILCTEGICHAPMVTQVPMLAQVSCAPAGGPGRRGDACSGRQARGAYQVWYAILCARGVQS